MGRKSSLTPDQWAEIERRHLVDGESINKLATEFGVNESSVRRRIKPGKPNTPRVNPLHALAQEKVRADAECKSISDKIAQLPYASQVIVSDLARKLTNISEHIGSAAEYSAASAHRLAMLANQQLEQIDPVDPLKSIINLKTAALLQEQANTAGTVPLNLIRANKDTVEALNRAGASARTIKAEELDDDELAAIAASSGG